MTQEQNQQPGGPSEADAQAMSTGTPPEAEAAPPPEAGQQATQGGTQSQANAQGGQSGAAESSTTSEPGAVDVDDPSLQGQPGGSQ